MNRNRRGFIEFRPIASFMDQFNDVLRMTDLTPGYIDTDHANDSVMVMGISEQFEEVPPGERTRAYMIMLIGDDEQVDDIQFIPVVAPTENA